MFGVTVTRGGDLRKQAARNPHEKFDWLDKKPFLFANKSQ